MLLEQTIRALVETLAEPGVLDNDRLREAISTVLQELHRIVGEKRLKERNKIIYPEEKCPCGECE